MANEKEFPGGCPAEWVPTPARLARWDARQAESLDIYGSVDAYSPKRPIIIGGAGLRITGSSGQVSGRVSTGRGGRFVLPDGTAPAFPTLRTRSVLLPIGSLMDFDRLKFGEAFAYQQSAPFGMKGVVHTTAPNSQKVLLNLPQMRLHNDAVLTSVRYRFRMGTRLTTAQLKDKAGGEADKIPRVRIYRAPKTGNFYPAQSQPGFNVVELFLVPTWVAGNPYAVDDIVHSSGQGMWAGSNGYTYRCIVAGTSGGASPTSTTIGNTVTDGSVTWRVETGFPQAYDHYALAPMSPLADADIFYAAGSVREIVYRTNINNQVDTANYTYLAEITDWGRGDIHHSLRLDFTYLYDLHEA